VNRLGAADGQTAFQCGVGTPNYAQRAG